ncbi:MAG: glutamyl-tRNA reductase [Eggerthellaceae bacterium]|nr:glutamyl-tRNA reductase [Eggerthellaceae bacterium]
MGLSFKTAPIELRERIALSTEETNSAIRGLIHEEGIDGASIISTCNRFEVYVDAKTDRLGIEVLKSHIFNHDDSDELQKSLYVKRDAFAIRHIVRVASSLDSQVLGEAQILGQVKRAFEQSVELGASTQVLTHLFKQAIHAGKRVHEETAIGQASVSLSTMALKVLEGHLGHFSQNHIVVVGAGEMAQLALVYLQEKGVSRITITSPTFEHAKDLAKTYNAAAIPFETRYEALSYCDAAFVALRSDDAVIKEKELREARLKAKTTDRQLFIIDEGLPRNVESCCAEMEGVSVIDLDYLNTELDASREARKKAAFAAQQIVAEEVDAFNAWYQQQFVTPTIKDMYGKAEDVATREIERAKKALVKTFGRDLSNEESEILRMMGDSIVKKILHGPTKRLKKESQSADSAYYTTAARYLFGLDMWPLGGPRPPHCNKECKLEQCDMSCVGGNIQGAYHG